MRLAFVAISNRIEDAKKLNENYKYDINTPPYIVESYTKNVLINPPIPRDFYVEGWNCQWKIYHCSPTHDAFWMRQDALDMAKNAELIYICDDDMEFKDGASQWINECCVYMKDNPDCGALYLGGNFGGEGAFHKDEIYIANKGPLGTNRGILLKNKTVNMDNRFHALGAFQDGVVGFTTLIQGYYIARRLHSPITHNSDIVIKRGHPNTFYDVDFIENKGIRAKMLEVLGPWDNYMGWPPKIFEMYREAAWAKGIEPRYTKEGSIIE